MSNLEMKVWLEEENIPKKVNFTTSEIEAKNIAGREVLLGKPIVISVEYEDVLFYKTTSGFDEYSGDWYKNERKLLLTEILYDY
ncbi:hypothetical protein CMO90_02125 [Candidatus Woesearchaeota archaeon]|nr:hypothetical protein [Candidatus Woesearchaeota archaeon]